MALGIDGADRVWKDGILMPELKELQQATDWRQKLFGIRDDIFSSVLPAFDELKGRGIRLLWFGCFTRVGVAVFSKIQGDVRGYLEPQLLREKTELETKLAAARKELGQCAADFRHLSVSHPHDYVARRASEVESKLSEL